MKNIQPRPQWLSRVPDKPGAAEGSLGHKGQLDGYGISFVWNQKLDSVIENGVSTIHFIFLLKKIKCML